ncbi:PREDICTED: sickle tail protein homolog isoform X2 [Corvus brachyrhynchos]|uniref:sickle tail protein homolog isoform X2 n=1 Tax=Corvus brachyrhynchos TaxID=85066 RepID=UPI0008167E4A|nr:PREDICTED: sickle tail protein homolog isoform X2 [Corvus brachyrhynchos]
MSKPSRLARPVSASTAPKSPLSRKEDFNSRSRKIRLGEKILRAGSEGNLVKQHQQEQVEITEGLVPRRAPFLKDQAKPSLHVTSLDDAECLRSKELLSTPSSHASHSKSTRNIPRRHTVGGPRSSKEILGMQTSEMDRKREAFLEHLKQKYPHHATAIMGHQERLRDQTRSPKPSQSPQPNLGDHTEHLSEASADSLEAMSEGDSPTPFSRGSRTRASLPVVRSANQTKERSLGVLYLQYGDETKQLRMPNEITSTDTIRALFVSAFPQQLTMKMLESPSVAIYIKDESRNIYYELCDVRNIQDRSFLKVYNKDPAHAFNHTSRAVNGDIRMQREIAYTGRDGPSGSRPGSATHPLHVMPSSPPSTPVPHSMPPSPSRIPYGGGRPMGVPGNATIPRDRLSSVPASRSISPSPSAILERRDVKPDEDMSNKNLTLVRNESLYGDPYLFHEGRMSVAAPLPGHPLDVPDHIVAYHRSAMRSSSTYCNPSMQPEMLEQSLYRQKSRKYPESHLPTLGSKTPPASPHRVADMRMIDIHPHHGPHIPAHTLQPDRSSPSRQSFKKEPGPPMFADAKARSAVGLSGMAEAMPSPADKQAFGYGSPTMPKDKETRERIQAMEKQIASLTGLVQSALFKGPNTSNSKDASSEKMMLKIVSSKSSVDTAGAASISGGKNALATVESAVIHHPAGAPAMQVSLHDMKRNVSDLRLQLHQMKQLQLQNQEMLRAMVKKAELEINGKVIETVKRLEDPVQRQRNLVEQERQKYLNEEEKIVKKLCELETFVEDLKKDSAASSKTVTLKDVEDGAFLLRQVGEAVATLKGEFPTLQNKMRAILRIEVEAVRFLKEEPHKLDSLLKRVRSMTDVLTMLRRHVTEGLLRGVDPSQAVQYSATEKSTAADTLKNQEERKPTQGHAQQNLTAIPSESQVSSVKSEVIPFSTMTVHHVQSSPVVIHQSQHSSALVNHAQGSPTAGSHSEGVPAAGHPTATPPEPTAGSQSTQATPAPQVSINGTTMQSLFIEEIHSASTRNRAVSIEKAEKKWEEKRQNLDHYNGKEFEKLLEEAQANIMKSIPNLEMPPQPAVLPKGDAAEKLEVSEEAPDAEQDNDKLTKSPPPPPPRRSYLPGSGLTTTRSGEVIYTARKEAAAVKECSEDAGQIAQSKAPKEDQALSRSTGHAVAPAAKDEEEEEGDKIMAELQAFQKCSFMDVNSNSHAEQSRNDTHVKDIRPGTLMHHKEKKVYGATTGSPTDSDHPKEKREGRTEEELGSDSSSTSDSKIGFSMNDSPTFSKGLFVDSTDYSNKNLQNMSTNLSGVSLPEEDKRRGAQDILGSHFPAVETGKQKPNYRLSRDAHQDVLQGEALQSTGKHIPISSVAPVLRHTQEAAGPQPSLQEQEVSAVNYNQVVLRPKVSRANSVSSIEDTDSPASSPSEDNLPTENIAFMITKTAVQVLSSGEVHDIVSQKGGDVQTVNIDARKDGASEKGIPENTDSEEPVVCLDKKPVIIIFDEPMDIRSAYKRLSTIFEECDEELEKMMTDEKIEEEEEDEHEAREVSERQKEESPVANDRKATTEHSAAHGPQRPYLFSLQSDSVESRPPAEEESTKTNFNKYRQIYGLNTEANSDSADQLGSRQDSKKKFKFKFPKKQLAALTQAIRTGTKTGKKTLQVVVYEEEEEDGTLKQHKEAKRFEITRSQPEESDKSPSGKQDGPSGAAVSLSRTDEIRQSTYRTLDSLEQTIKQLENTISEMSPKPIPETTYTSEGSTVPFSAQIVPETPSREHVVLDESLAGVEPPASLPATSRKGSSAASQTSRMPVPMASKTRQGSMEKSGKQHKLQDPRQYRQANGSAKKAGGDYKATSPTLPASKIPAFSPTSGKSSSAPASSGDSSNPLNPPTKTSIPSSSLLSPQTGRITYSTSLIPSVSNGSSKFQSPTYPGKGHHLSFSLQTQNGRPPPPSSSTSPPSSLSPPSLNQGMKSIRTIHTPSFNSYKAQNGNAGKSAPSTVKEPS